MKLVNETGLLTDDAAKLLLAHAPDTTCECPKYLIDLLLQVRDFQEYQKGCLKEKPADAYIHEWLSASGLTLDAMLSGMILQLAHMEGLIDAKTGKISPVPGSAPKAKKSGKK